MARKVLETKDLRGYYRAPFGVVQGVDGVSISVYEGESLGIAGESGCGKSTFIELLTGTPVPLLKYEGGEIHIEGYDILHIDPEKLRKEVKCVHMSYVPQSALSSLNPTKRIKEFVADMLKERTGKKHKPDEAKELISKHFKRLGLDPSLLDRYPHELSGGEKQRVNIAISTFAEPTILLVDEPTSSLDVSSQKKMVQMLVDILRRRIIRSLVAVSHDLGVLRQMCDRLAVMYGGRLVEVGKMDDVVAKPLHPYTKLLLGSLVPLEKDIKNKKLKSIPGSPPDLRNPPPGCRFHPRCPKCMEICKTKNPPMIEVKGRGVACWLYVKRRG
jgi:peptide/nickel transport system ATP-binding protein